jgi:hypothetical protein
MSADIWIPQAPECRVQPYEDEPDYFEVRNAEPFFSINMSNMNFAAVMGTMPGLPKWDGQYARWEPEDLPAVRACVMRALNSQKVVASATAEDVVESNYVFMGRSEHYVQDRLLEILQLVKLAHEHGFYVVAG